MPGKAILSDPEAQSVAGFGRALDAPPFREPWEAQAFALAVTLHDRGLFTSVEWAETLGAAIGNAAGGGCDDGSDYYAHWLAAIETLVALKALVSTQSLQSRRESFHRAAQATPHGHEIRLENDPQRAVPP